MTDHQVRHILRGGDSVCTEYRCVASEGAPCRVACLRCWKAGEEQCRCEAEEPIRVPEMGDIGSCMVLTWLSEDAPEECFNGEEATEVRGPGWQPITPEWNGDNYEWDYASIDPDTVHGLYDKYRVHKVNGKPVGECFVLEKHDPLALPALRAYAEYCAAGYPQLSADLTAMANRWHNDLTAKL